MGASSSRIAQGSAASVQDGKVDLQTNLNAKQVEAKQRPDFDHLVKEELALQAASIPAAEVPSCLTLFDKWLSCYALGVQFKNAYRYGEIADCAPRKEDFKFCLSLRAMDPEARRHEYLLRRAEEMAHRRKGFHMSEAVWEMRRDPLLDPDFADPAYPLPTVEVGCTLSQRQCGGFELFQTVLLPNRSHLCGNPIPSLPLNDALSLS